MTSFLKRLFEHFRPRKDDLTRQALRDVQIEMKRHTDSIQANVRKLNARKTLQ